MRRVLATAAVLVAALAWVAAAQPAVTFVFKGKGWGHGIGLGQYGAQGYADREDRKYPWILRHYYPGTSLVERSATIRVLLVAGRSSLVLGSDANFRGGDASFAAGNWTVRAGPNGRLELARNGTVRRVPDGTTFRPGGSLLEVGHAKYRGRIVVRRSGSRVWALNRLGLDAYVKGVVPREMPSSWHPQALRAQAVAARSYALAAGGHCSWFGQSVMCKDVTDQVYGGYDGEAGSTNAAVDATAKEVLVHDGVVATTFFSSTTGGKTAAKHHEWGGERLDYLVSVPDPYDGISPHHSWGPRDSEDDCPGAGRDCVWSGAQVGKLLSAPAGLRDMTVTRNASSRVATVRAVGSSGSATFSGATMRARLGLRSTWFTIGVLRLRGGGTIDKGEARTLRGLTRNVGSVRLQRRRSGEAWTTVKNVSGAFRARVRPGATTYYRLSSPSGTTDTVRVAVRAQLRFAADQAPGALAGVALGTGEGRAVQVQRREDGGWTTVGTALVGPGGSWTARFGVTLGVYRAYVAPGRGEPVATSPRLTVVAG
ncbi:MAG TPA: SpoIID/LytB domain-containing protein [Gaiellaceae bacterium]|nr:SpoIID/LytB domain-containing protein [Gaiellaceae bacterium]